MISTSTFPEGLIARPAEKSRNIGRATASGTDNVEPTETPVSDGESDWIGKGRLESQASVLNWPATLDEPRCLRCEGVKVGKEINSGEQAVHLRAHVPERQDHHYHVKQKRLNDVRAVEPNVRSTSIPNPRCLTIHLRGTPPRPGPTTCAPSSTSPSADNRLLASSTFSSTSSGHAADRSSASAIIATQFLPSSSTAIRLCPRARPGTGPTASPARGYSTRRTSRIRRTNPRESSLAAST